MSQQSDNLSMSKILPYLYLGSLNDFNSLRKDNKNRIETTLSYCLKDNRPIEGVNQYQLLVWDDLETDIAHLFSKSNSYIHEARSFKKNILVHCASGISRAPSFIAAYLLWSCKVSLDMALDAIRARRPYINPNRSFFKQLQEYEITLSRNRIRFEMVPMKFKMPVEDKKSIESLAKEYRALMNT
ncbi:hypothetical protein ACOME3_008009 [Neoechinorhynchus agilis]